MFQAAMSNSTLSEEATLSGFNPLLLQNTTNIITSQQQQQQQQPPQKKAKKKRSLPGNPDPDAEVIALSPKSLLATNRFICEICNKGFQRDQNLQLHRRGHNLPWKLKQRNKLEVVRKKAYVCPEPSCVHHHPSRALGDLTGIKKHFCRKHGEKKFKCEKCSKIYAVHSDWKAHSKTCGTREYRCDCGTLFSRKDSFITHRAFCDALVEESQRLSTNPFSNPLLPPPHSQPQPPQQQQQHQLAPPPPHFSTSQSPSHLFPFSSPSSSISLSSLAWDPSAQNPNNNLIHVKTENDTSNPFFQQNSLFTKVGLVSSPFTTNTNAITAHFLSATALLQNATAVGSTLQQSQQQQQQQQSQQAMLSGFDELLAGGSSSSTTTTTTNHHLDNPHQYNNNNNTTNAMMGMTAVESLAATWRKNNEDITRDFLGLAAGDHYSTNGSTGNSNAGLLGVNGSSEGGNFEDDEVVGNMLKFTGGLQYSMTAPYDRDNSSSSSSSILLKPPQQQQSLVDQHHHQVHEGDFGPFVIAQPPTAAASESRWA